MSKGDKNRTKDFKIYRENYDKIIFDICELCAKCWNDCKAKGVHIAGCIGFRAREKENK